MKTSKKTRKHLIVTGIITLASALIFLVLFKGLSLNPSVVASSQIGKPALDFDVDILEGGSWLPKSNGTRVSLADLKGKPVILNFWASWCVSCRQEASELERFWQHHREKGIIVLGIAIQDTAESAREFAKLHGKSYPIALDNTGKTSINYGVSGVPETFVINAQGVIVHKEAGPISADLLETLNSKYLASPSDRG